MNELHRFPGFTAEASLRDHTTRYRGGLKRVSASAQDGLVTPQVNNPTACGVCMAACCIFGACDPICVAACYAGACQ